MLASDSPLLRLPVDLPRDQILFTDALRLSAQMATISYQNLEHTLALLTSRPPARDLNWKAPEALCYAYGVIDAANRFREVLRNFPGLKQNDVFKLFIRTTALVEDLRDIVQHLNAELRVIGNQKASALGTITWLAGPESEGLPPVAWMFEAGSTYDKQRTVGPVVDLLTTVAPGKIAHVSLRTSGVRVDLSEVVRRVRDMLLGLEQPLRDHSNGKELMGSDVLVEFSLQPVVKRDQNKPEV